MALIERSCNGQIALCDLTRLAGQGTRGRGQILAFLDQSGRVAVANKGCERALYPAVAEESDERLSGRVCDRGQGGCAHRRGNRSCCRSRHLHRHPQHPPCLSLLPRT